MHRYLNILRWKKKPTVFRVAWQPNVSVQFEAATNLQVECNKITSRLEDHSVRVGYDSRNYWTSRFTRARSYTGLIRLKVFQGFSIYEIFAQITRTRLYIMDVTIGTICGCILRDNVRIAMRYHVKCTPKQLRFHFVWPVRFALIKPHWSIELNFKCLFLAQAYGSSTRKQ